MESGKVTLFNSGTFLLKENHYFFSFHERFFLSLKSDQVMFEKFRNVFLKIIYCEDQFTVL